MTGEYWVGWSDKWGEKHYETEGAKEAAELSWMLEHGYSMSLCMFHGGTSFGWMNGADTHTGTDYHPDSTSYDYDAPFDERDEPLYKFELFRKAIAERTHVTQPEGVLVAGFADTIEFEGASFVEDLDQSYGYVLYRTGLDEGAGDKLVSGGLHDYAQVYLDQQLMGTLDRRLGTDTLDLPRLNHASTLDILVENTGRVNYSNEIMTERAGLTGDLTVDSVAPKNWEIYSLPMEDVADLRYLAELCSGSCFFQAEMTVKKAADTHLETRGLHRGRWWVGTHNLGWFWSVGPQYALYTPSPWLQPTTTTLTFFNLLADSGDHLSSLTAPVFGATVSTSENQ